MMNMGRDEEKRFDETKRREDETRQHAGLPANNTDNPETPPEKRAKNNPSGQDEGLSGYRGDSPLAEG